MRRGTAQARGMRGVPKHFVAEKISFEFLSLFLSLVFVRTRSRPDEVYSLPPSSYPSLALLYIYFPRLVLGHDLPFQFHECRSLLRVVGFTIAKWREHAVAHLASPPRARLSLRVDLCGQRTLRDGLLSATRGVTPTRRSHCAILAETRVRERRTLMSRVQAFFFCINRFFGTFEVISYLQSK